MTAPTAFLRETYDELRKVTWPSRNEVTRLTLVVIFISVMIGVYIGGIDYLLTKLIGLVLK